MLDIEQRLKDQRRYEQVEQQAIGAPPPPKPVDGAEILGREIERLNSLSNGYTAAVDEIKASKIWSDEHKQSRIANLRQQAANQIYEMVARLYGEMGQDGYSGGLVEQYINAAADHVAEIRKQAEADLDLDRLGAVQAEVGGSLGRFANLQSLRQWFEDDASDLEKRALLSQRDAIAKLFRDDSRIGSFLAMLDRQQESWRESPAAQDALHLQFELDRQVANCEAAAFWALQQINEQLTTGPFASPLTRRMESLHPRNRTQKQRIAATPIG